MDIKLTPRLEDWVRERLATGLYDSESEVVREALRIMQRQQELLERQRDELREDLQAGIEQLDRGEGRDFDADALEEIKKAGREKLGHNF